MCPIRRATLREVLHVCLHSPLHDMHFVCFPCANHGGERILRSMLHACCWAHHVHGIGSLISTPHAAWFTRMRAVNHSPHTKYESLSVVVVAGLDCARYPTSQPIQAQSALRARTVPQAHCRRHHRGRAQVLSAKPRRRDGANKGSLGDGDGPSPLSGQDAVVRDEHSEPINLHILSPDARR
jgi:hypothetical protein